MDNAALKRDSTYGASGMLNALQVELPFKTGFSNDEDALVRWEVEVIFEIRDRGVG